MTPPLDAATVARRYARPGPRYTSYPTAPHFRADDPERPAVVQAWRSADAPLAVYGHVPYCERRCLYCGCHVQIARDRALGERYVDDLLRELRLLSGLTDLSRPLEMVAFGGGTPTWLSAPDLERLVSGLQTALSPTPTCQWSIEVDPRSVDADYMALLERLGFGRYSFGVQDIDPAVMQAVGRSQGRDEVEAAIAAIGDKPFNIDLMYGLPRQTPEGLQRTLDVALGWRPNRIALFGYAHVPWIKKHQRGLERHGLPGDDERLAMHLGARARLVEAGYVAIGIDHFALPGDPMAVAHADGSLHRNFMGYTVGPELDLVALGVSAISQVAGTFTQNTKDVTTWRAALDRGEPAWERTLMTSDEDRLRNAVIMDLMCHFAIDIPRIEARFGIAFREHFRSELEGLAPFVADGLVTTSAERISLTREGELVARNVAMLFDAWLGRSDARYSRTV